MTYRDLIATKVEASDLFGVKPFSAAAALRAGISSDRLVHAAAAGELQRLRRGMYSVGEDALEPARERIAQFTSRGVPACIGERTAADLWWVPQFGVHGPLGLPPLTLLVPRGAAPRRGSRAGFRVREVDLDPKDIVMYQGVPVTRPLRTGLDVARLLGRSRRAALVTLSGGMRAEVALRRMGLAAFVDGRVAPGLTNWEITEAARDPVLREELAEDLTRMMGMVNRHGMRWVSAVAHLAEPLLESWLEGVVWADLTGAELPRALPQAWVKGASGQLLRSDFLLDGRVILEVDGSTKYASQTPWQEKQRQADLEAAGYWVVRCTWEELLRHPERVLARIRQALERSRVFAHPGL